MITNWVHDMVICRLRDCHFRVMANRRREPWPRNRWLHNLSAADAVIAFMPDHIDDEVLRHCKQLKIIAGALKGYDNIDVEACARRGIMVTHSQRSLTAAVAELTVGLLIGISRNLLIGDRLVRAKRFHGWRPQLYGVGLAGSTVGFIGMGEIGQATVARLRAFDCRFVYFDVQRLPEPAERELRVKYLPLRELAAVCDFVILAIPLMPDTLHLVNSEFLALMKPSAYLINPARGSLVDEAAVARAIRDGKLGGYAADVFEFEDLARRDRPAGVVPALLKTERAILSPHLGSAIDSVRCAVAMDAADNIVHFFTGGTLSGVVTPATRKEAAPC